MKEFFGKKTFLALSIVLLLLVIFAEAIFIFHCHKKDENLEQEMQREYKVGFITDIHGKIPSKKTGELDGDAKRIMSYFVDQMNNAYHPDFVINDGDLIEGTDKEEWEATIEFKKMLAYFQMLNVPSYHVNGNHEMRGLSKKTWAEMIGQENNYYYFDYDDLRVIILDGNENEKIESVTNNLNRGFYYLSEDQFQWLEKTLTDAKNERKIVFIHYPPFNTAGTKMIEPEQSLRLRNIFSKNKVMAVFSGHTEILDFKEIDGVQYFVLPGLERSRLKDVLWLDCFAEISIKKNSAEAKLFYKKNKNEEYKTLIIPSEEFNAIEK